MVQTIQPNVESGKTRFFFIRHGQTEHNIRKILQGHLDIPINDEGHSQASQLGSHIATLPLDRIYSSDLTRCRETLAHILEARGEDEKKVIFTSDLRERHMGEIQGMHIDDAIKHGEKHGKHYREFGETSDEFEARLQPFLKKMKNEVRENQCKNVAVISHGGTIRAVLKTYGVPEAGIVFNTSVTVIDFDWETDSMDVKLMGDTEHLGKQMNVADQRVR